MESGAILLYLADKTGQFGGTDRWTTLEWLMLQMGGVGPMLGQANTSCSSTRANPPTRRSATETKPPDYTACSTAAWRITNTGGRLHTIADMATWP